MKKTFAIGFLGTLRYDTRSHNLMRSLQARGHRVTFSGADWMSSGFTPIKTDTLHIFKLRKGRLSLLFYGRFFLQLFMSLVRQKADVYVASDFFALPVCALVAWMKGADYIYDAREIYQELASIQKKPLVKKLFKRVESAFIKSASCVLSTGELDSQFFIREYGLNRCTLLRNLPNKRTPDPVDLRGRFQIPSSAMMLLYQGIIMEARGLPIILDILTRFEKSHLIVIGWGGYQETFQRQAADLGLSSRIHFTGKLDQDELLNHTAACDAGLCLIENVSLSYYYALPNKLFEYIMAGLPVLVTNLPQLKKIVETHGVGAVADESDVSRMVTILQKWHRDADAMKVLRQRCVNAARELNWEVEFENAYPDLIGEDPTR